MIITVKTLKDGEKTTSVDNVVVTVDSNGFSAIIGSGPDDNTLNYSPTFGYCTEYPISGEEWERLSEIFKEIKNERNNKTSIIG